MDKVELLPVAGFEGLYAVTSDGRIWSFGRSARGSNGSQRRIAPRWLSPGTDRGGYQIVALAIDGKLHTKKVHRLVAQAWLPLDGDASAMQINHKNGIKSDNRVENLEWCTSSQNLRHAWATGLQSMTEEKRRVIRMAAECTRKLTPSDAEEIRRRRADGETYRSIAKSFGINVSTAFSIINHKTYLSAECK